MAGQLAAERGTVCVRAAADELLSVAVRTKNIPAASCDPNTPAATEYDITPEMTHPQRRTIELVSTLQPPRGECR